MKKRKIAIFSDSEKEEYPVSMRHSRQMRRGTTISNQVDSNSQDGISVHDRSGNGVRPSLPEVKSSRSGDEAHPGFQLTLGPRPVIEFVNKSLIDRVTLSEEMEGTGLSLPEISSSNNRNDIGSGLPIISAGSDLGVTCRARVSPR